MIFYFYQWIYRKSYFNVTLKFTIIIFFKKNISFFEMLINGTMLFCDKLCENNRA